MRPPSSAAAPAVRSSFDHLRWIAALAVVFQHARSLVMVDYAPGSGPLASLVFFAAGFSHQAVIIFFVLSGNLVGGSALRMILDGSSPERRRRFVLDRFTRIAIVLWPAMALTLAVALVAPVSPVLTTADWSAGLPNIRDAATPDTWAATAVMLNELAVPTVPYDGPLWSLAYEWSYYVLAATAIFVAARDRSRLAIGIVAYALILVGLSAWRHPQLLWMMSFWIAGAAASRVMSWRCLPLSFGLFALALLASRFGRPAGFEDATVAAATAILIADRSFQASQVARKAGAALASFSFSLYAVHWPVTLLAVAVAQRLGLVQERLDPGGAAYAAILLLVGIAYAVAVPFARATEARTAAVRSWLLERRRWLKPAARG